MTSLEECIHGFEGTQCDVCFPKSVPAAASVSPSTRVRTASAPRSSTAGRPDHKVGEQRIYHVTHRDNLPGIIAEAALRAPVAPVVDASSEGNREARRDTPLGAGSVADYVPFFLSPNATVWSHLRAHLADERLSREVRDVPAAEFVILVSTVTVASGLDVAVADGDAANTFTRFGTTPETTDRMLRSLRSDDEAILGGEFLVLGSFPFEKISLVGVANDRARDTVKEILAAASHEPKVAVYPPWFASD